MWAYRTSTFNNGTSCVAITYRISALGSYITNCATYKGCYYKLEEKEGALSFGVKSVNFGVKGVNFGIKGVNFAANYTSCDEDFCNGSENVHKSFCVIAIACILFVLFEFILDFVLTTSYGTLERVLTSKTFIPFVL